MKEIISWICFVLTVLVFILDIYFMVAGIIDIQREKAALANTPGVSGSDYLGVIVGQGFVLVVVVLTSVVGAIFALIAGLCTPHGAIVLISYILLFLFFIMIFPFLLCLR